MRSIVVIFFGAMFSLLPFIGFAQNPSLRDLAPQYDPNATDYQRSYDLNPKRPPLEVIERGGFPHAGNTDMSGHAVPTGPDSGFSPTWNGGPGIQWQGTHDVGGGGRTMSK